MTKEEIIDRIYEETLGNFDKISRIEQIKIYIELYDKIKAGDRK
jgi:hypothetical protein